MKILAISPGADWATVDVFNGLIPALQRQGHQIIEYPLDRRIGRAKSWLDLNYQAAVKNDPTIAEPTFADMLYLAGERALPLALRENVDWVLCVSGMYLHPDWLILMQRAGLHVALLLTESPYDDERQARVLPHVDVAWTNERSSFPFLWDVNPNVYYLPHAYDPAKHFVDEGPDGRGWPRSTPGGSGIAASAPESHSDPTSKQSERAFATQALTPPVRPEESIPAHDVCFVGTAFQERVELLAAVDWSGIDLGLYGNWKDVLPEGHPLLAHLRAEVIPNAHAAALYRRAKIGLNLYRRSIGFGIDAPRIEHAESLNPRALELAACGAFHLSDHRAEVAEVFGELVPTFSTGAELETLIRSWLPRPAERAAIAAQLPGAVADRTFDAMAAQVTANLTAVTPVLVEVA